MLHGDVQVAKLAVEDGATLNGNVSMSPSGGAGSNAKEEPPPAEESQPAEHQG